MRAERSLEEGLREGEERTGLPRGLHRSWSSAAKEGAGVVATDSEAAAMAEESRRQSFSFGASSAEELSSDSSRRMATRRLAATDELRLFLRPVEETKRELYDKLTMTPSYSSSFPRGDAEMSLFPRWQTPVSWKGE